MSFFRRLFGNSPGDDPSPKVQQSGAKQEENTGEEANITNPIKDPLATGELAVPVTDKLTSGEEVNELDQTLPLSDEFDEEVTLPERRPDFEQDNQDIVNIPGVTRPLPEADQFVQASGGHLAFGQASDQGMVRSNNQDSAFSFYFTSETVREFPDFGVFVVGKSVV